MIPRSRDLTNGDGKKLQGGLVGGRASVESALIFPAGCRPNSSLVQGGESGSELTWLIRSTQIPVYYKHKHCAALL